MKTTITYKHPHSGDVITSDEIDEVYVLEQHGSYEDNPDWLDKYGEVNPSKVARDTGVGIAFWIKDSEEVQLFVQDEIVPTRTRDVFLSDFTEAHFNDLAHAVNSRNYDMWNTFP